MEKRKYSKIHCPHCNKEVSKSSWYNHYNQYYDKSSCTWHTEGEYSKTSSFNFGSSSEESGGDYNNAYGPVGEDFLDFESTPDTGFFEDKSDDWDFDWDFEIWDEDDQLPEQVGHSIEINPQLMMFLRFVSIFILSWQTFFRMPDVAIDILFRFIHVLLSKLLTITDTKIVREAHDIFPRSLDQARKFHSIHRESYTKFIVCQKCHTTYNYNDVMKESGALNNVVKCSFVRFPRHSQKRMRNPCMFPLLKSVKTSAGKQVSHPLKLFCYKSIIQSLEELMHFPGMLQLLNHWKSRNIQSGVMADIYDGFVWKSFINTENNEFLGNQYGIGLLINVDWFQPYKHVQYSVGVIYLAVLNLPRCLRYRRENMIIVGIIPGPHEPSVCMNSYLEVLVLDLLKLWQGVILKTPQGPQMVRAALICNSSDVPACRKVAGFVGHAALKACSRCLKSFPTASFGEKADYSGFNTSTWPQRSIEHHRAQGLAWKHACTMTERIKIERQDGVRFTELLRLPYFDTIRFSVVDPMHNIFLGSAKLMISLWKEHGIITPSHFDAVQTVVDQFVTPSDVGRIPYKISSGFSSFTADQWKNWTLIFSLVALKGILPDAHYRCWHVFVQASAILCSRAISQDSLEKLHHLLICFCRSFEQIYGSQACTPNIHYHCHLKECIRDFGPPTSFWLFACERMNGLLGSIPTNNQSIEVQLMRKFCSSQQVLAELSNCDDPLQDLLAPLQNLKGSLKHEELLELPVQPLSIETVDNLNTMCKLMPTVKEGCFTSEQICSIDSALKVYFPEAYVRTLMIHEYGSAVQLGGILYGSVKSIHHSSALVQTKSNLGSNVPGFVERYVRIKVLLQIGDRTEPKKQK